MRQEKGEWNGAPPAPARARLVGKQAGKGLPQVADGFGLGLVFTWGPALGGVGGAEAVRQGLGFAETERQGGLGATGPGTQSRGLAWKPAGRAQSSRGCDDRKPGIPTLT